MEGNEALLPLHSAGSVADNKKTCVKKSYLSRIKKTGFLGSDEIFYIDLSNEGQRARKASGGIAEKAFVWKEEHTRSHGGWKPHRC